MVYHGLVGKSTHSDTGGGIDYQCLSSKPEYLGLRAGLNPTRSYMTGVEYEDFDGGPLSKSHFMGVPCAVCYTQLRSVTLMIPGQYSCPSNWTREYYGYLTSERHSHTNPSTYACTHKDMEALAGTGQNKQSGIMMHVEASCVSHICPPYVKGNEMTCAVCTR